MTEASAITLQANATTEIPLENATLDDLPGHLDELTAGLQGTDGHPQHPLQRPCRWPGAYLMSQVQH